MTTTLTESTRIHDNENPSKRGTVLWVHNAIMPKTRERVLMVRVQWDTKVVESVPAATVTPYTMKLLCCTHCGGKPCKYHDYKRAVKAARKHNGRVSASNIYVGRHVVGARYYVEIF